MNNKNYEAAIRTLKQELYIQGFNAVPIFLNLVGLSGFFMKEKLGFGYTQFTMDYKDGYCEYGYLKNDFETIWNIIKEKIKKDKKYLFKIEKMYFDNFKQYDKLFDFLDAADLVKIGDSELVELFKKHAQAMVDSVGVAHIVDAIGVEIEKEFKEELFQSIPEKTKFNYYVSELSRPSELSFLAEEENELLKIKKSGSGNNLERHAKKYFWLQNSYAGLKKLDASFFKKKMDNLPAKPHTADNSKSEIIKQLKLKKSLQETIGIIDFVTIWQDRRKANILKTIGYFGVVIDEISRRTGVESEVLYYLGLGDSVSIKNLDSIRSLQGELEKRKSGSFFVCRNGKEAVIREEEYLRFKKAQSEAGERNENRDLHGSIANMGTAIGRVAICKGINSLDNVQAGDVLVSSMTRPEFMPALKKAVAIVTDEGGITCHAAIVARELGIPAIIGTKIATKILKNGMVVEVKANHGIVKILN